MRPDEGTPQSIGATVDRESGEWELCTDEGTQQSIGVAVERESGEWELRADEGTQQSIRVAVELERTQNSRNVKLESKVLKLIKYSKQSIEAKKRILCDYLRV